MLMSFEICDILSYLCTSVKHVGHQCTKMNWSVYAQKIKGPTKSLPAVDWSCCLHFKEDTLREGEWVCHESMNL